MHQRRRRERLGRDDRRWRAPGRARRAAATSGTVKIAINPWVGAEANVAVVEYLLETELGYTVEATSLAEEVAWQGFETGEVDVILENWGHPDLEKKYIDEKKVAAGRRPERHHRDHRLVRARSGWSTEHPDITDWKNLNKYADLFKTSESGDQGQFLGSDPTFVTNDEALIENLELNFKVRSTRAARRPRITAFQQADRAEDAADRLLLRPAVAAQPRSSSCRSSCRRTRTGCDADPKAVACDYPPYTLNKIVATKFAETGGDAYTLIKNFKWTNADQNLVADYITNQKMTADEAGEKWVADNEAVWSTWMP